MRKVLLIALALCIPCAALLAETPGTTTPAAGGPPPAVQAAQPGALPAAGACGRTLGAGFPFGSKSAVCRHSSAQLTSSWLDLQQKRADIKGETPPQPTPATCVVCQPCTCSDCHACCGYYWGCLCVDACGDDFNCEYQCERSYYDCVIGCSW
jgi:hypothetical protein